MTTASPIPASLATACAAHDRHRLDVIDALLDEAAPSAVRELLGAALDLCASLRADRDTLAAKLDATPKVCAIHSYALEGPCMTCGAPWPGAEKALRQERVEGMEKMLRISRAVGCPNSVEEVVEAVAAIKADLASERAHLAACRTRIAGLEQAANERSAEVARLTARVAELEARPVNARAALIGVLTATKHGPGGRGGPGDCDADCVKCEADRALASLGAPPTSPPAARPVFAGVSVDELARVSADEYDGSGDQIGDADRAAIRAVLARLEVSLVAPVDPEAVALRLRDHAREIGLHPQREPADYLDSLAALVRVIFTAAGIPVAPEVRK